MNIGCGTDITIKELAELIVSEVEYEGQLVFDTNKLNGTPRKLLDTNRISQMGWQPKIKLIEGLERTILEFKNLIY